MGCRVEVTRIGLDLSRKPFQLHGVDKYGGVVLRKAVRGTQLQETFAQLSRCVIGLESCGTAYRWGQQLADLGHEVRLISPQAVAPHLARLGSDASHAQGICEALGSPGTPFSRVSADKRSGGLGAIRAPTLFLEKLGLLPRAAKRRLAHSRPSE
jgi:transposase